MANDATPKAGVTKAHKLAKALLSPKHLPITKEIVERHIDAAMKAGEKPRLQELFALTALIDDVEGEQ